MKELIRIWIPKYNKLFYEGEDFIFDKKGICFLTKPGDKETPQVEKEMYFNYMSFSKFNDINNKPIFAQDFVSYLTNEGIKAGKILIFNEQWGVYNVNDTIIMTLKECIEKHSPSIIGNTYTTPTMFEDY